MTPTPEQINAEWSAAFHIASIWVNYQPLHSEVTRAIATALATARLEERNKTLDEVRAAAENCPYDMGVDPETGPIGCRLHLQGDTCVCAGIIPPFSPQAQGKRR